MNVEETSEAEISLPTFLLIKLHLIVGFMEEIKSRFRCPTCDQSILNRKIDRCLYCGATLPAELLLPKEIIDELNEQERVLEVKRKHERPVPVANESGADIGGAADVISDAIDIIGGLGDLFD